MMKLGQQGRGVTPSFRPQENNQEEVLEGRKGDRSVSWQGRREHQLGRGHSWETVGRWWGGHGWLGAIDPICAECVCEMGSWGEVTPGKGCTHYG